MGTSNLFLTITNDWDTNVAQGLGLPTIYGNEQDTIDKSSIWCRLAILPGTAEQVEFTPEATHRIPGVVIAQIFGPLEEGDGNILELLDSIEPLYRRRTVNGVKFQTPSPDPIGRSDSYYQFNFSIPFIYDYVAQKG